MTLRSVAMVVATTLGLGLTVAVSWFLFGGTAAFRGPFVALRDSWPLIYGSQAVLAGVVGWLLVRSLRPATPGRAVSVIGAAWIGEWAALFVGGTLVANELTPGIAWFFWLLATGGPIQPLAAIGGGALASRRPGVR